MTPRSVLRAALPVLLIALLAPAARAQLALPTGFADSLVVGSLAQPVGLAFIPDAAGKPVRALFIEQKTARLRLIVNGQLSAVDPIGTVPNVRTLGNEQGLLSVTVDPRWPAAPYVYMHYSTIFATLFLSRFKLTGDLDYTGNGQLLMDVASRYDLITDFRDQSSNHNGGTVRFGPDEMLWMSMGEDFQSCLAQDTTSLSGKILRLDVKTLPDSAGGPPAKSRLVPPDNPHADSPNENWRLVWALGLRNPFRFHIDPLDGSLFVADVGELTWEEIDHVTAPANLGWPYYEADTARTPSCPSGPPASPHFPIVRVPHPTARSIISLGVYRRPAGAASGFPSDYEGTYFFSDYYGGILRRLVWDGAKWQSVIEPGQPNSWDWASGAAQVSDGLVGPDGALWYVRQSVSFAANTGSIRRIVWRGPVTGAPGGAAPRASFAPPWPNPAAGAVTLAFSLPATGPAAIEMHDASGRRVRALGGGVYGAGAHVLRWDGLDDEGRPLPAGLYWARLRAAGETLVRRVVRVR